MFLVIIANRSFLQKNAPILSYLFYGISHTHLSHLSIYSLRHPYSYTIFSHRISTPNYTNPLPPTLFRHTPLQTAPHPNFQYRSWHKESLKRTVQGLTSVLLSLHKSPVIRYQNNSELAKQLADYIKVSL